MCCACRMGAPKATAAKKEPQKPAAKRAAGKAKAKAKNKGGKAVKKEQ